MLTRGLVKVDYAFEIYVRKVDYAFEHNVRLPPNSTFEIVVVPKNQEKVRESLAPES